MKYKKKILIVMLILITILLIIIGVLNVIKKSERGEETTQNTITSNTDKEDTQIDEEKKEELLKKLKKVSESERIRIYLGTYFKHIENKEYGKAYDLLYSEFKKSYFPSIEDFESYIEEQNYPDMLSIEYKDISRQGEYYEVTVMIKNFLDNSDTTAREMTLVIKENDYNDYYLSFTK